MYVYLHELMIWDVIEYITAMNYMDGFIDPKATD